MVEPTPIPVANLRLDIQNPRLSVPNEGQRETLREIAHLQGSKLRALAQDIVEYGLNPSDLSIVTALESEGDRFVVLDGNRRLAAIRALENPEVVDGVVEPAVLRALRRLNEQYRENPIEAIPCLVVENRTEATHWLELRHTGERDGAGPVLWGAQESARFRSRGGRAELHTQALDFLEARGDLSPDRRKKVRASTYQRLLGTPEVRSRLGIAMRSGRLEALADEEEVARALLHVANDIADGNVKVADVYTADQRRAYARELPESVVVVPVRESGAGVPLRAAGEAPPRKPGRRSGPARPKARSPDTKGLCARHRGFSPPRYRARVSPLEPGVPPECDQRVATRLPGAQRGLVHHRRRTECA